MTWLLLVPVGSAADPPDQPGMVALTGDLLDEGAGAYGALQLSDALARTGSQLEVEVGADATLLTLTTLVRCADRAVPLLADVAIRPRFEQGEFSRVRDLRLNRLLQLRNLPSAVADRAFLEALYPLHPYGHLPIGTTDALKMMEPDEVKAFHRRNYRAKHATLIAVGDASHDQLLGWAAAGFEDWSTADAGVSPGAIPDPDEAPAVRAVLVHRPGAPQSELRVGHVALSRGTADYHAALVLNVVLGGQFISRLNVKLREERGFTYGARSSFEFRRGRGPFVVQVSVQSTATAEALAEIVSEVKAIRGDRPATEQEVTLARASLTRGYPRNFETAEQVARAAAQLALYELPDDYFSTFAPLVEAVDPAAVTQVAARHLGPHRLTAIVVGDRAVGVPALEALAAGPVREVEAVA